MIPYNNANVSFSKIEEIGFEGQNSRVFRAHDKYLDAEIVIKEIKKESGFSLEEYFTEARILYKSDHPHVVRVFYACEDDENAYIAMPYYCNGSLKKVIEQRFLTVKEIIRYSTHFLSGLQNVHSKDLIHFDIKPDNILLSNRNEALLSDFGQSKTIDIDGIAEQPALYVKHFAPEVLFPPHNKYDNRIDIYQAGLTMYRMSVGEDEFNRQFEEIDNSNFASKLIDAKFPDRGAYPWHIPRQLIRTINKCLSVEPDDRYDSPIDIVNSLASIDGHVLDWQYIEDEFGRTWTRRKEDGGAKVLHIDPNGRCEAYNLNEEGHKRRISKQCKEQTNKTELARFLDT